MTFNRHALFAILLSTSLVTVPFASVSLSAPAQTPSREISIARMGLAGVRLGTKAYQVERKLGKPQQVKTEETRCCGTLLHWSYAETKVSFIVPDEANQEQNSTVYAVSTRNPKLMTVEGVRVGDRRSKVLRIYGLPNSEENDQVFYGNSQYATSLSFRLENDRVVEIRIGSQLN